MDEACSTAWKTWSRASLISGYVRGEEQGMSSRSGGVAGAAVMVFAGVIVTSSPSHSYSGASTSIPRESSIAAIAKGFSGG